MLAELPEKLTIATGEAVGFATGGNQDAENRAFDRQRSDDERFQATFREALGKGKLDQGSIRFIYQNAF